MILALCFTFLWLSGHIQIDIKQRTNLIFKVINNEASSLQQQTQAEIIEAQRLGLKPYLYFYADWCDRCQAINRNLKQPQIQGALLGTYIIAVDINIWSNKISKEKCNVDRVPTFFELDQTGQVTTKKLNKMLATEEEPDQVAEILKQFFSQK